MVQYIDKSALVAEIEKAINSPAPSHDQQCPWEDGYWCGLYTAESIIDTLEVKEPNVDDQIELIANGIMIPVQANLYHTNLYNTEKRCFNHSHLKEAARKGFELGLKAQKGE